jgi:phosphorylcholine metabolism protein LicD
LAYKITLSNKNKEIAESLLLDVAKSLDILSVNYWLEGGTLLGIKRESRLLPWDNDLDLSINSSEVSKIDDLIINLKSKNLRVRVRKFDSTSEFFNKGDIRIIKIRNKRFFNLLKGSVCLEIFVKYPKKENTYWMIGNTTKNVPSKYYANQQTIKFKDYLFSIPVLTEEYLTFRYGDWKKPVKEWNTFTDDKALN